MDDDCICKQTLNNTRSRFRYDFSGIYQQPLILQKPDLTVAADPAGNLLQSRR